MTIVLFYTYNNTYVNESDDYLCPAPFIRSREASEVKQGAPALPGKPGQQVAAGQPPRVKA